MYVCGVNEHRYASDGFPDVVSNASCTTNCLVGSKTGQTHGGGRGLDVGCSGLGSRVGMGIASGDVRCARHENKSAHRVVLKGGFKVDCAQSASLIHLFAFIFFFLFLCTL